MRYVSVWTAASSKHPDDRMALIAACEAANAAAVQTVLIVLGEIPLNKLLKVFHQELICSLANWSVWYHHVKTVKSAVE
jgi:hypothetical protein